MNYYFRIIAAIAIIAFVIFVIPMAGIWSLNTLFPVLAIGYSIETWFAALVLMVIVGGGIKTNG